MKDCGTERKGTAEAIAAAREQAKMIVILKYGSMEEAWDLWSEQLSGDNKVTITESERTALLHWANGLENSWEDE